MSETLGVTFSRNEFAKVATASSKAAIELLIPIARMGDLDALRSFCARRDDVAPHLPRDDVDLLSPDEDGELPWSALDLCHHAAGALVARALWHAPIAEARTLAEACFARQYGEAFLGDFLLTASRHIRDEGLIASAIAAGAPARLLAEESNHSQLIRSGALLTPLGNAIVGCNLPAIRVLSSPDLLVKNIQPYQGLDFVIADVPSAGLAMIQRPPGSEHIKPTDWLSPLQLAARGGDPEVVEALVDNVVVAGKRLQEHESASDDDSSSRLGGQRVGLEALLTYLAARRHSTQAEVWSDSIIDVLLDRTGLSAAIAEVAGKRQPPWLASLLKYGLDADCPPLIKRLSSHYTTATMTQDGGTAWHAVAYRWGGLMKPRSTAMALGHALAEAGCAIDAVDRHGKTCLHMAVANGGQPWAIRALLELGADPSIKDARGWTPASMLKASNEPIEESFVLLQTSAARLHARRALTEVANESRHHRVDKISDHKRELQP
jgi:hypothetical protein